MENRIEKINLMKVKPLNKQQLRNITGGLTDPDPNLGMHLDSWIDADGSVQGNAATYIF